MPSRVIRGEILSSNSLSRLSCEAEAFFWRLLLAADDYGRLDGRLPVLRSVTYPAREVPLEQIEAWLAELESCDPGPSDGPNTGPVLRYQVERSPYIALVNWERHRSNGKRGKVSRFPDPPRNRPKPPEESAGIRPSDVWRGTSSEGRLTSDEGRETSDEGRGCGGGEHAPAGHRADGLGPPLGPASALRADGVLAGAARRLEARRRRAQYGGGS